MSDSQIRQAVVLLKRGGVIAYPTEAVFGLGCDPCSEAAVRRLLAIKHRSMSKGLILIASSLKQLQPFIILDSAQHASVAATWPGPVTWLIPARKSVPKWLRGRHSTLAVRVTAHPLAAALCTAWGGVLVSTSANVSTKAPARDALSVRCRLGSQLDYVLPGPVGHAERPTEIRDLITGRIYRKG